MSRASMTISLVGECHCGQLRVALDITRPSSEISPRVCDCRFCRKHGAAWVSDPLGMLRINASEERDMLRYRQGSETADMLLCAHCGVLVAVVFEYEGTLFGAINAGCINDAAFAASASVSPQSLSQAEKIERWRAVWARAIIEFSHSRASTP
jgi:hypothetical protein